MNRPSFNIVELLKAAFNDIEINGIQTPHLLDGWMCPLYKKKDHCEIPNYRSITILNAEYKILTTAIMNKLSNVALDVIHKTQTAFIKGHSIFNQIDLAR